MNETTQPNYSQKDATMLLVTKKQYSLISKEREIYD